tara:strand:+ start:2410 stop:2961 length:552 start_codon:yes stop_codon:yes gene_type:complete
MIVKKILKTLFIFIFFLIPANSSDQSQLDTLFEKLKFDNETSARETEMKIWGIWQTHPKNENLTSLLSRGISFMNKQQYQVAEDIFSTVIELDPSWAEAWNKRATVFYLMGKYKESQNDIDEVLKLEKRHFGALSGQGLVQIKLENFEKALRSYEQVEQIYPSMISPKIMIPQIKEMIKNQSV